MKFPLEVAQSELTRIEQNIKQYRISRKRLIRHADLIAELQPDSVYSGTYDVHLSIFITVPGFTTIACPWLAEAIECLTEKLGVDPTSHSDATNGIMTYRWEREDRLEVALLAKLDDNALCLRIPVGEPEMVKEYQMIDVPRQRYAFHC